MRRHLPNLLSVVAIGSRAAATTGNVTAGVLPLGKYGSEGRSPYARRRRLDDSNDAADDDTSSNNADDDASHDADDGNDCDDASHDADNDHDQDDDAQGEENTMQKAYDDWYDDANDDDVTYTLRDDAWYDNAYEYDDAVASIKNKVQTWESNAKATAYNFCNSPQSEWMSD